MVGTMETSQANTTENQSTLQREEKYHEFDYREHPNENESWDQFLVRKEAERRRGR